MQRDVSGFPFVNSHLLKCFCLKTQLFQGRFLDLYSKYENLQSFRGLQSPFPRSCDGEGTFICQLKIMEICRFKCSALNDVSSTLTRNKRIQTFLFAPFTPFQASCDEKRCLIIPIYQQKFTEIFVQLFRSFNDVPSTYIQSAMIPSPFAAFRVHSTNHVMNGEVFEHIHLSTPVY